MVKRRGVSAVGCLVNLVVLAALVYFGTPFVNAYLDYFRYKDAMQQEAKYAGKHVDSEIQFRLKLFADSLGLPTSASAVRVTRSKDRASISGSYVKSIAVPLVGPKKLRFNPKVESTF